MAAVGPFLQPLEDAIRNKFLPALFNSSDPISEVERKLYALPVKLCGLAIENPVLSADVEHESSKLLTHSLTQDILASNQSLSNAGGSRNQLLRQIRGQKLQRHLNALDEVLEAASTRERRVLEVARIKGSSYVFTSRPIGKYGFAFKSKRDFRDLLAMRYNKPISHLPGTCACGKAYSLDHSQVCKLGGFIHMRHDEPKELFADLCREVFPDVEVEPPLQPLSGEEMAHASAVTDDEARSDVRVRGFWSKGRNAFFEFRVSYPHARCYLGTKPENLLKQISKTRKREYGQRVREVEDGDFTPMVMFSTGGLSKEMLVALNHLAGLLAVKRNEDYETVVSVLRCSFAFCLARSSLVCLRGSRPYRKPRGEVRAIAEAEIALQDCGL